ncbi:UNVERIFIED_CONTAM: integrase, partial [Euhalothece sp. KZN 001]
MSSNETTSPPLAPLLQSFFGERLVRQRQASHCTIAAYRDTFRLLLRYLQERRQLRPSRLSVTDLDADCVLAFLDYLEQVRGNSPRTRNARLAAIRSFLQYASWREPMAAPVAQQVFAIPMKRFERSLIESLTRDEIDAILAAPDTRTACGYRDRVMLTLMYNTGARVSEATAWRVDDASLGRCSVIRIRGKGRKERSVPLWRSTASLLRDWLKRNQPSPNSPLLPNARGVQMTRSGLEQRLRLAVRQAATRCPSLGGRRVSPHTLRHTTAMHLLQSGVDLSVIAMWLGHESPTTTHHYLEANLMMKQQALGCLEEPHQRIRRCRHDDQLLQFL